MLAWVTTQLFSLRTIRQAWNLHARRIRPCRVLLMTVKASVTDVQPSTAYSKTCHLIPTFLAQFYCVSVFVCFRDNTKSSSDCELWWSTLVDIAPPKLSIENSTQHSNTKSNTVIRPGHGKIYTGPRPLQPKGQGRALMYRCQKYTYYWGPLSSLCSFVFCDSAMSPARSCTGSVSCRNWQCPTLLEGSLQLISIKFCILVWLFLGDIALKAISPTGIQYMLPICGLSVCLFVCLSFYLSRSCIVLKRQNISTRFFAYDSPMSLPDRIKIWQIGQPLPPQILLQILPLCPGRWLAFQNGRHLGPILLISFLFQPYNYNDFKIYQYKLTVSWTGMLYWQLFKLNNAYATQEYKIS